MMGVEDPVIDFAGVAVRVRTADARTGAILRTRFRPWHVPGGTGGIVDLELSRVRGAVSSGRPPSGAAWRERGGRHRIVSRWFRLEFDAGAGHGRALVSARFGMADFCRPMAGALLAARGGFLLHAAALEAPGGGALLFCGPSGFGKTTLAKSVPRRVVLADDSVGIRLDPDRGAATAHPTPFFGDFGRPPARLRPGGRPVRALFLLETPSRRTAAHAARPATAGEAAARVMTQILMAAEAPPELRRALLDRAVAFVSAAPVFWFRYVPGKTVWAYLCGLAGGR